VKITTSDSDKKVIITESDGNGFLYLSDLYYPGWSAYIDGNKTPIYRANYAFRTILLPEGNHRIVFQYEPKSLKIGSAISLVSLVAGLICLLVIHIRHEQKRI